MSVLDISPCTSVKELIMQMKDTAFNARRLGKAFEILQEACREESIFFIGLAGALSPSGMRFLIAKLLESLSKSRLIHSG